LPTRRTRQFQPHHPGYGLDFGDFRPHIHRGDRLLDFGCGNGGLLRHAVQVCDHVEGLEADPAARVLAAEAGRPVYAALEQIPPNTSYDLVMTSHVLEHIPDPLGTLVRLRPLLRPGGKLLVKLPIDDVRDPHQRSWSRDDIDKHVHTWTPRLFANLLFEAGYEVNECRVLTSAWHPRLLWTAKLGLGGVVFGLFAVLKNRRQLFAVATNPG